MPYVKEALKTVFRYLFLDINFHRVWVKTRANNIRSIKALEKLGFAYEGCLCKHNFKYDGTRHDVVEYARN